MKLLGVDAVMDPDQTCCSGYLLTCSAHKPEVSLAVTARNLAIVEKKGLDTYTFCNGCFGYISELAHILLHNPGLPGHGKRRRRESWATGSRAKPASSTSRNCGTA